jgi:hypothetical protein
VQHCTQSENIGAAVGSLSAHLLWRHVANCSQYLTRIGSLVQGDGGVNLRLRPRFA